MHTLFATLLIIISFRLFSQESVLARKYGNLITKADLKDKLSIIASDALEGRMTGSRGQKMAAAFISHHFKEWGLAGPVSGSYFQPVDLYQVKQGPVYVKIGSKQFDNYADIIYLGQADTGGEVIIEVIFAGSGNEEDYTRFDVKGKAVAILMDKIGFSAYEESRKKVDLAKSKGAAVVIIASRGPAVEFIEFRDIIQNYLSEGQLTLSKPGPGDPYQGLIVMSSAAFEGIFGKSREKLQADFFQNSSKDKPAKPLKLSYKITRELVTVQSENVLGYLEGTDKKNELVIVTAHLDHIGKMKEGEGDLVNNGADDDGSGTVTVMELAKAFAQAKKDGHGPRRSILFMAVTGEEEGLFGSQYYVENPVFPLANTVVDLNIDMIGRSDAKHAGGKPYVYVIGSDKLSTDLHQLSESVNTTYTQLEFDYLYNDEAHPERLYYRSDHWNFAKNKIPIIFYFDGIHEDYHKPSDEIDKIDFDLLARRAQCVFFTTWEIANREGRIVPDKK